MCAGGPCVAEPWLGDEEASGEVVAELLDELGSRGCVGRSVEHVDERVVEDVLELVGKAEALAGDRLARVDHD